LLAVAPAAAQTAEPGAALTPVQTATLQPTLWRSKTEIAASLAAQQSATLAAARSGTVTGILFRSGQSVAAGQVLIQLDNGPDTAQLALDKSRLDQATRDYARMQKLMSIAGASQSALEQAAALAAEAKAQVSLDEANLAQLQITAPFAGTTGIRKVDPGDYLQAGQAVLTLTANGPLRVLFSIPQTEAGNLSPGAPFTLTTPTTNAALSAPGTVVALSPEIDPATNARDIEGRITSNTTGLLAGMFGVVDIATGAPIPAFAVPSTALNDSTLGPYIYVLHPTSAGAATLGTVYVTIYGTAGNTSYIGAAGLQPGAKIVAIGGFKLSDGAAVTPQTP
jgi:RND family efflux transporter MFP subunit